MTAHQHPTPPKLVPLRGDAASWAQPAQPAKLPTQLPAQLPVQAPAQSDTPRDPLVGAVTILAEVPQPPTPIGLIAGGGGLPVLIAKNLRAAGHPVHGLGLLSQYESNLPSLCSTFRDVGILRLGSWGRELSRLGVRHAIMVGKVDKARLMHDPLRVVRNIPDFAAVRAWYTHLRKDKRSHAVLTAVANELDRWGVTLLDSTAPIPDELSDLGVMTRRAPTAGQMADVEFGWPLLAHSLRLDIGQALAVRELDVISVEAVEGTDRMIERTGRLCKARGWTLLKGARIGHDRRSDVPTVGPNTVRTVHANGGGCIALAAGQVIMLEKAEMVRLADKLGVAIIGVAPLTHLWSTDSVTEVKPGKHKRQA